ncbi:MAG: hypothetical protein IJA50_03985 [Firmicutes bacterium]|nr:hypothetical protein [Bacillota bacterium]
MSYEQKEAIGKLFRGYVNISLNPQSQYRKDAAVQMSEALNELQACGISFDVYADDGSLKELLMLTDGGIKAFVDFVHQFMACGYDDRDDMSDIVDEQIRIAGWVKEHKKELIR